MTMKVVKQKYKSKNSNKKLKVKNQRLQSLSFILASALGCKTSPEKWSELINNLIYKFTDLILTHNEFSKSEIIKGNANLSSCIYIVPHGNYTPFINIQDDKEKSRKQLGIPIDKKVLLFFGMIKKVLLIWHYMKLDTL